MGTRMWAITKYTKKKILSYLSNYEFTYLYTYYTYYIFMRGSSYAVILIINSTDSYVDVSQHFKFAPLDQP